MGLTVQKFGGTSVADADRIRAVADLVTSADFPRTSRGLASERLTTVARLACGWAEAYR